MAKQRRDYRAEYARRVAAGQRRGLTKSQARGHAKANEASLKKTDTQPDDALLQFALRAIREEGGLKGAAKSLRISPERLRRITAEKGLLEKRRGRWQPRADLPRIMRFPTSGRLQTVKLADFSEASKAGRFRNAVKQFRRTNQLIWLRPFAGDGARDASGKNRLFETDPNVLHRLLASEDGSFEQIYRIVI